jgi:hypothetical protein
VMNHTRGIQTRAARHDACNRRVANTRRCRHHRDALANVNASDRRLRRASKVIGRRGIGGEPRSAICPIRRNVPL